MDWKFHMLLPLPLLLFVYENKYILVAHWWLRWCKWQCSYLCIIHTYIMQNWQSDGVIKWNKVAKISVPLTLMENYYFEIYTFTWVCERVYDLLWCPSNVLSSTRADIFHESNSWMKTFQSLTLEKKVCEKESTGYWNNASDKIK